MRAGWTSGTALAAVALLGCVSDNGTDDPSGDDVFTMHAEYTKGSCLYDLTTWVFDGDVALVGGRISYAGTNIPQSGQSACGRLNLELNVRSSGVLDGTAVFRNNNQTLAGLTVAGTCTVASCTATADSFTMTLTRK